MKCPAYHLPYHPQHTRTPLPKKQFTVVSSLCGASITLVFVPGQVYDFAETGFRRLKVMVPREQTVCAVTNRTKPMFPRAQSAATSRPPIQMGNVRLLAPNGTALDLAVADTQQEREAGLQGRANLPTHHGMLFVFADDEQRTFWMKGVPYPLDFVFVSSDGRVSSARTVEGVAGGTTDDQIPRFTGYGKYVIAIPAGEATADGFQVGTILTGLPVPPTGQH